jgi:hypothetical protein
MGRDLHNQKNQFQHYSQVEATFLKATKKKKLKQTE